MTFLSLSFLIFESEIEINKRSGKALGIMYPKVAKTHSGSTMEALALRRGGWLTC